MSENVFEATVIGSNSVIGESLIQHLSNGAAKISSGSELAKAIGYGTDAIEDILQKYAVWNLPSSPTLLEVETHKVSDHPLRLGDPPDWASEWGHDEFGPWCSFQIEDARQVLRWIPAGQFLMGVPEEFGGVFDEVWPRHWVTVTRGFWMFESLCSRQLFDMVMRNQSGNTIANNDPIVNVTIRDARNFCSKLSEFLDGVSVALPTDAQWEFACRAGRSDDTEETPNAEAHSSRNPWGLQGTLANIGQLCGDGPGKFLTGDLIDPVGEGEEIVVRGLPRTVPNKFFRDVAFGSLSSRGLLPSGQLCHPSFREYFESDVSRADIGFRCIVLEDNWTPASVPHLPDSENGIATTETNADDVNESATVDKDDTPLATLLQDMALHLQSYYTELLETSTDHEIPWRLIDGQSLCEAGRRVVDAIPDSVPDSKDTPNFPEAGGRLWYLLLRTSRSRLATFEAARPFLAAAAKDLNIWLRLHYSNYLPGTLVQSDLPFSLRLNNLLGVLAFYASNPRGSSGRLNEPLATGHPVFNEAVGLLVQIPDVTNARDGTPTFPGEGGTLWEQLLGLSLSNDSNELRNAVALQLRDWLIKQYGPVSLESF